ncbi:MAG: glycine oxidase ThiO [Acidobacteriota bacterium]
MNEAPIVYPRRISHSPDVLVIGGGIVGLSIARALDDLGFRVDVLEAHTPGAGASNAAAGMLSPITESHERPDFLATLLEGRNLWPRWAEELQAETAIDVDFSPSGALLPAFDTAQLEGLDRIRSIAQELDEPVESVDPQALQSRYPEISPKVRQSLFLPGESTVDNVQVTSALSESLFRRGVIVHRQREVLDVVREGDSWRVSGEGWRVGAAHVVVAAGAWTPRIRGLPKIEMAPIRGQMISFHVPDWQWSGAIRCERHYSVRRRNGEVLIGATVEDAGFDASTTESAQSELVQFAHDLFPKLRWKAVQSHWAGLRPGTDDGRPVLGPAGDEEGLILATGHYRNGILLAPWTAARVAEFFKGDADAFLEAYLPDRFHS